MADIDERTFGELTVQIDRLICVGFGDCIDGDAGVFELDDEGIAVFRNDSASIEPEVLIEACRACPVDALIVVDSKGIQLAP